MREIIFRGKSRNTGEWLSGALLHSSDEKHPMISEFGGSDRHWADTVVDPDTIGQYTGRDDINGNRIFEGDIVDDGKHVGAVKWMQGKCCFQVSPGGVFLGKNILVIGNIHDNPELLEN